VFPTAGVVDEGHKLIPKSTPALPDIRGHRPFRYAFGTFVETLEFDNLIVQAVVTMDARGTGSREPLCPCTRGFSRELDDKNWISTRCPGSIRRCGHSSMIGRCRLPLTQRGVVYRARARVVLTMLADLTFLSALLASRSYERHPTTLESYRLLLSHFGSDVRTSAFAAKGY